MLRTYFVQQWFNLSEPGAEELLYESAAVRRFVGVDLGIASMPDETDAVNVHLEAKGIKIQTGTIVDATRLAECYQHSRPRRGHGSLQ